MKKFIDKIVERAINEINHNTAGTGNFIFTDKDGKEIETGVSVMRISEDYDEFVNAVQKQVEKAIWGSICYRLRADIHDFQQGIEQRAKMTTGKIHFAKDKIAMIETNLPEENRFDQEFPLRDGMTDDEVKAVEDRKKSRSPSLNEKRIYFL